MNKYTHKFNCRCPKNGNDIAYTLVIKSKRMILAEDIESYCSKYSHQWHEYIADELRDRLPGKQKLFAVHGKTHLETVRIGRGK